MLHAHYIQFHGRRYIGALSQLWQHSVSKLSRGIATRVMHLLTVTLIRDTYFVELLALVMQGRRRAAGRG